jgi:FixJ family two-component response regulator
MKIVSLGCVFVIENDLSMRAALMNLLRSVKLDAQLFGSPSEFLNAEKPDGPSCLILDVRLPGISGLDLQKELTDAGNPIPVIFVTAHGDIPMSVRAMKAGAVEFLTKPFRDQDLLDAIHISLSRDSLRREQESARAEIRRRLDLLTSRERELLPFIISGQSNKQVAAEIGTSETTVKVHRGKVMRKMHATSLAHLLQMAAELRLLNTKV